MQTGFRRVCRTRSRRWFASSSSAWTNFWRRGRSVNGGITVFAGPKNWRVFRLQVDIDNELHWGQASLTQLLWLLDEHQPCGVVVVDHGGARFYRFWMGEVEEQKTERFEVDTFQWRGKTVVRTAGRTVTSQRDAFERRRAAHYARMFRESAKRIGQWARSENLDVLFVAGANDAVEPVWNDMPDETCGHATRLTGDYVRFVPDEMQGPCDLSRAM